MNRKYSLNKNHDIEKLIKKKQSVGNKYFAIYFSFSTLKKPQIAFSISKKFGKAVKRNYHKRVVKEIVRNYISELDYVKSLIVIKSACEDLTFLEKKVQLNYLLKKIIKIKEKNDEKK